MTITKFIPFLILLSLSVCTGCEDKIWTTLPPETQTGANTFGCMIDNDLFVGESNASWFAPPAFRVGYDVDSDKVYMDIRGLINGNPAGTFSMIIDHPNQIGTQTTERLGYYPSTNISLCLEYLPLSDGEVILTRFDTVNKIVSGRFQFTGYCVDSTNVKQITQGRFDLKFDLINSISE